MKYRNPKSVRFYQLLIIVGVLAVIIVVVRCPDFFQTAQNYKKEMARHNIPVVKDVSLGMKDTKPPTPIKSTNELLPSNPKPKQLELKQSQIMPLEQVRRDCGELCNTSRPGVPGLYFNHVKANINCHALFENPYIDRTHNLKKAPKFIPPELIKDFTMDGKIKVFNWYFDQPYLGKKAFTPVWTYKQVEDLKQFSRQGKLHGNYGIDETNAVRDSLQRAPGVMNGRVLVIGSEYPWLEACVLESGAREIVTLEYGEIVSEHPQIKTLTPMQFRKDYLSRKLGKFDAVVTFSSVEHSGLGRYGDALNPWGDIIAIARSWCVTKKGGSLTIGVMYDYENDAIRFNAGRWYGKVRYPYLANNWNQFYRGTDVQRVHVFTNGYVNNATHISST